MAVRPPKQKRSQESLERVIEASLQLLEEKGFDAFTIQDVSRRSDVSVGAIYARFVSREQLLREVHRQAMEHFRAHHDVTAALVPGESLSAEEAIRRAIEFVASIFRTSERLLCAFMHLGSVDEEVSRRGSANSIDLSHQFAAVVLQHRDEITHRSPETAVDVAYRMAYCTFARRVMNGPAYESDRAIEWDPLIEEVGDACVAYLLRPRD